jgi:hypothetical protein
MSFILTPETRSTGGARGGLRADFVRPRESRASRRHAQRGPVFDIEHMSE